MQESLHVYIKNGLAKINQPQVNILEFGFGTGLNALLAAQYSEDNSVKINYTTLEKYPVIIEEVNSLNYPEILEDQDDFLGKMHRSPWQKWMPVSGNMNIFKIQEDFRDFESEDKYDLVFFDVFGYRVQPHLWDLEIFKNLFNHLNNNALLTTYCSKGVVRRNLEEAGFEVDKLEGPPGKREMINAWKR